MPILLSERLSAHPLVDDDFTVRTWRRKFKDAFRGFKAGIRGQSGFFVHFFMAVLVVAAAAALGAQMWQWTTLVLCIGLVFTAEMFNSALETLAKAVTQHFDQHIHQALNIAAAAVLLASITASIVGLIIFASLVGPKVGWW